MFCEEATVENLIKTKRNNPEITLQTLVVFDNLKDETKKIAQDLGLKILLFKDIIEEGKKNN